MIKMLLIVSSFFMMSSCGKEKKKDETRQESKEVQGTEQSEALPAEVPVSTILVVPLDKDGNEVLAAAEMRSVNASLDGKSSEELIELFKQGEKVDPKDEISDDFEESSTASWFWHKKHRACGGYNYCNQQPRCVYQAQQYQYAQVYQGTYCGSAVQSCGPVPRYRQGYADPYAPTGYLAPSYGFASGYHVQGYQVQGYQGY